MTHFDTKLIVKSCHFVGIVQKVNFTSCRLILRLFIYFLLIVIYLVWEKTTRRKAGCIETASLLQRVCTCTTPRTDDCRESALAVAAGDPEERHSRTIVTRLALVTSPHSMLMRCEASSHESLPGRRRSGQRPHCHVCLWPLDVGLMAWRRSWAEFHSRLEVVPVADKYAHHIKREKRVSLS